MKEIVAKVTSKGQVTVPVAVRRLLGVDTPDSIAFVIEEGGKVAVRRPRFTLETVFGSVPALGKGETVDSDAEIEEALEEEADRIVRGMGGL